MPEKLRSNETEDHSESRLDNDPNIETVDVSSEYGFRLSHSFKERIAEDIDPHVNQGLCMLVEAGNQIFALSEVETASGKRARIISLAGKKEDERAQLIHFFDPDKAHQEIAIGRRYDEKGIYIDDGWLSREHFAVSWDDDGLRVRDLESTHGTRIGKARRKEVAPAREDRKVATTGLMGVVKKMRKNKPQEPVEPPISETSNWSVPSEEILTALGEPGNRV